MATQPEIVTTYQATVRKIRAEHRAWVLALWASMASFRAADVDRMLQVLVPRSIATQRLLAQLTEAYAAALGGFDARSVDESRVTGVALRGKDPADVYRRAATEVYRALAENVTFPEAVQRGQNRLESVVMTDLQLAVRAQERESYDARGWTYYRRVLTGDENCALCILASTQRYRVGTLKPIHPGCDCDSAPIGSGKDPGQVINADLLENVHELLGGNTKYNRSGRSVRFPDGTVRDYRDILVRDHGEYGPTLTWRGQTFTGPDDLTH